ncbi:hypothetical protein ACFQ2B_04075 [Streptomyces stramineus]
MTVSPETSPEASPETSPGTPAAASPGAPAAAPDTDASARRLAYLTVGVPTLGFAGAVVFAFTYGFTAVDIGLLVGMYLLTSLGVEGGFHRFFSHLSFAAKPGVTAFWGIAGSMAAQGPVVFWVATHRQHHAFTDRDGDPHSPRPREDGRRFPGPAACGTATSAGCSPSAGRTGASTYRT